MSKPVKKSNDIDLGNIKTQLVSAAQSLSKYRVMLFFLAVMGLYGFIMYRINVYSNAPPSQSEAQVKAAAQPHIDAATIEKMKSLQNNSVNVQSFFNDRANPFQE